MIEENCLQKQKLVGVIHELTMGGAERMMVNILNHFFSNGDEVHLIIFKNIGTLKGLLHNDIIVHDLERSSVKKGMSKCLRTIHKIRPDIVFSGIGHVNIALAPFIPLMRKFLPKTRWISRETNIVSLQNQEEKYPKVFDTLYRKTYQNFDVIIAQSEDMKDDLEQHYPATKSKITLVNNPINIEKVNELSSEKTNFKFAMDKVNLISVGTLRYRKRHDLLLKGLSKLPNFYTLTIVGSGEEESNLKIFSHALGLEKRVRFEGHQTNPYPYVKGADLFVLTSEHEGFPNVLLEANSLGIPVIAFACPGGITEIIEEGINGYSVLNGDVKALALTIEKAIAKKFDKEWVVDSVKRRYSHAIIFEKYEQLFYNKGIPHGS
jgi:glycosyltransferase involved in cell wall biosynthesis